MKESDLAGLRADNYNLRCDKDALIRELAALTRDHYFLRRALVEWQSADYMRLHGGKMTDQEVRAVQAVLSAIERSTRDGK